MQKNISGLEKEHGFTTSIDADIVHALAIQSKASYIKNRYMSKRETLTLRQTPREMAQTAVQTRYDEAHSLHTSKSMGLGICFSWTIKKLE